MSKEILIKQVSDAGAAFISRRDELGLKQREMRMTIGMVQQQYQALEAGADMKLSTLLRITDGLNLDVMLVPRESKVHSVGSYINAGIMTQQCNIAVQREVAHLADNDNE